MILTAMYRFHPVGQGLFCSGSLSIGPLAGNRFRWVYDCGSLTSNALVKQGIDDLKSEAPNTPLDLLILSHFDRDHISGAVQILTDIGARTILLPWAPLWHRLLIALQQGIDTTEDVFQFFVDPVAYLAASSDDGFGDVIFVLPSDGEEETEPDEGDVGPRGPEGELTISFEKEEPNASHPQEWSDYVTASEHPVRVLKKNSALTITGLWEFVPYNDPKTAPSNQQSFASKVDGLRTILMNAAPQDIAKAFETLRVLYRSTFRSSETRNNISLYVYAGSVGRWDSEENVSLPLYWRYHRWIPGVALPRASILYTGDGYLNDRDAWLRLQGSIGSRRLNGVSIFQISHHGAFDNWYEGLALEVNPQLSIISSDPGRNPFFHPHPEVLRDFWTYHPIQVDQHQGYWTAHVCVRDVI